MSRNPCVADAEKMKRLLELNPRPLHEGLMETLEWILAHKNIIPEYVKIQGLNNT